MNISDATAGRTSDAPVVTEERSAPVRERVQVRQEAETTRSSRSDEYIPTPEVNISNALYDVHNVTGGAPVIISSAPTRSRSSSGETVGRKIVEFLLPTGRKSLTIYSMDVQSLNDKG